MMITTAHKTMHKWMFYTAISLFAIVVWLVFIADNKIIDEKVFAFLAPYISSSRTNLMKDISFFGNHKFLIPANILLIVYLMMRKNKKAALTALVVSLSSLGMMSLLKNIIQRHRPDNPLVEGITNFSFPSGHAFMSVAFYGLLIWWQTIQLHKKWEKVAVIIFLSLVIMTICFSRIYLRVHYTTDVIAGTCIGISWLLLAIYTMHALFRSWEQKL